MGDYLCLGCDAELSVPRCATCGGLLGYVRVVVRATRGHALSVEATYVRALPRHEHRNAAGPEDRAGDECADE